MAGAWSLPIARTAPTSAANAMDKVADFVVSHRRPLLWVGGLAAVLLTALLPLNTLNDNGDKLLVIFDRPRDVKGTAFLTYTHRTGPDDQWLYLPALKRVKRIASNNKSGPFMGSEFSYEDLASQEVDKYTYRYLRDEAANERDCFVVERVPVDKDSGYTRQIVWYDKNEYRPEKIEFYDRKDELLKTLTYSGYEQYGGGYWRAHALFMENRQTGKSTLLTWDQYELGTGLSYRDFDRNSLKRAR